MNKKEKDSALIALRAKRGEIQSNNLSTLQMQLFTQFSEFDLRKMAKGWYRGDLNLRPLPKPDNVIKKPKTLKAPKRKTYKKKDEE